MSRFIIFETAIGWAGLIWADQGLIGTYLPEPSPEAVRHLLTRRYPDADEALDVPEALAPVITAFKALLQGKKVDFVDPPIDIGRVPDFNAKVYAIARSIPPGETLTYGEIAVRLGDKLLARDVGLALGQNPWPLVVPCHRVTAAGGKLGGFSARGGAETKLKLLKIEGAPAADLAEAVARRARSRKTPDDMTGDLFQL